MNTLADLTQCDVERILEIVDRLKDVEVRLELPSMKLHVRKFNGAMPAAMSAAAPFEPSPVSVRSEPAVLAAPVPAASAAAAPADAVHKSTEAGLLDVLAPMLGTFYRASSPSEPAFVNVGSTIQPEDTVCVLEVMKLFNTVPAGISGTIAEILVKDGEMVEYGQVLFRVRQE